MAYTTIDDPEAHFQVVTYTGDGQDNRDVTLTGATDLPVDFVCVKNRYASNHGCGFYDKANINLYQYIHCYLNIPDTSGRDSLFQAEARRCKEILDKINKNVTSRHFCIFDELYSGTNPTDAVDSAFSFLSYLSKFKNLNFILTTHYVDLCEKLNKNKTIENKNMKIIKKNNDIIYTYKLTKGICNIKGGNKILKDLGYPEEIISTKI